MVRKFWLGITLAAGLGVVVSAFALMQPEPATPVPPARVVDAQPPAAVITAAPVAGKSATARPVVAYDRYRAEMQRLRAARQAAHALQSDERCIGRERFRKVGAEWVRAGDC